MEIEDRIRLDTPEGVPIDLLLAGVGSRFSAALIDVLIQGALLVALALLVAASGGIDGGAAGVAIASVGSFLVVYAYDVLFETLASGRTPGKRVQGLRVVLAGGEPVTFLAALIRNLLRIVDFLPGLYAVGIVTVLATRRNQRVGDLVAGTVVVRERRPAHVLSELPRAAVEPHPATAGWDVTRVAEDDVRVAAAFLTRRATLPPSVRDRVAAQLAARLRALVVGADPGLDDESLIERVVARKVGGGGER